jgi:hypothetical protein
MNLYQKASSPNSSRIDIIYKYLFLFTISVYATSLRRGRSGRLWLEVEKSDALPKSPLRIAIGDVQNNERVRWSVESTGPYQVITDSSSAN